MKHMNIIFHESTKTFHLYNNTISYMMTIYRNGHLGQLYFGKHIRDKEDFSYLVEMVKRGMMSCVYEGDRDFSLQHLKQEYPVYGSTDYRDPAIEVIQENGSHISDFIYVSHEIIPGKPKLSGLPATYVERDEEALTLRITLRDPLTQVSLQLLYTIYANDGIIARSAYIENNGKEIIYLNRALSLCLDLPDKDYDWLQFSGSWARERHLKMHHLEQGTLSISSKRGNSSLEHNPFIILKRPHTTEFSGEAMGFSFVYSGNHLMQAEVDTHDTTRILIGINPFCFHWKLAPSESFQTPEAILVYSENGLNGISQTYHKLYRTRLARGYWRDRPRPILVNNWEATYFDFDEEKLLQIASKAKEYDVELFVLDDGWFGNRCGDTAGLGDWYPNTGRLPHGISGLSEKVEALGLKFGLWFEPEMLNKDSDLFRTHPDWLIHTPHRNQSHGRNQFVLNFSRPEVVDYIYEMIHKILYNSKVSYIKWDMNRSITECYSVTLPADRQGEVFHRYILGVYRLYERLIKAFPEILFESCASGGGRFDPGMLYYAPQGWASDNSDAIERLKIQYGTSMCYPLSSIGSHVSVVPNHQVNRITPLKTRANVAYFGVFGYQLDLNNLTGSELAAVKEQIQFVKQYREIIQFGTFYRLQSPFEKNETAWMVVSDDKKTAILGWYRVLNGINIPFSRIKLQGLDSNMVYENSITKNRHYGDELMNLGLITSDVASGEIPPGMDPSFDFDSRIFIFTAI